MKQCPVCGREVVSKRKDAVYCKDSVCRKKAHQSRKEQAAASQPAVRGNKASVVVSFPDGSRWLLELSPLQAMADTTLPSLMQITTVAPEICSGSVPVAPIAPAALGHAAEIRSEQIQDTSATPSSIMSVQPPVRDERSSVRPVEQSSRGLRTIELFFADPAGRRLFFRDSIRRRVGGGWAIKGAATARLGMGRNEGYGLGGVPGRWRDYYPNRSPTEFGLDADLAVLYADDDEQSEHTYAADAELLRESLGVDWRALLRACADGKPL